VAATPDRRRRLAAAAAAALALGFSLLVAASPDAFFLLAAPVCVAWAIASAIAARPGLRARLSPRVADVLLGIAAAGLLYAGARGFLWTLCGGLSDVLCAPLAGTLDRFQARSWPAALVIALLLAPAEELFWRGLVQPRLVARLGAVRGVAAAVALAIGLALATGEPFLALAMLPTYAAWGALAAWRGSLVPGLVSHAAWSVLVAAVAPPG
jgi:membrane protease YdiL (CAAX protease family)